MKRIIVMMITVALLLTGCSIGTKAPDVLKDRDKVGTGDTTFQLVIVDGDENAINVTVSTDKEMLGDALQELHIIDGKSSAYGLYITIVNGIYADDKKEKTYWALYINDAYAEKSISETPVSQDEVYTLKLEKIM